MAFTWAFIMTNALVDMLGKDHLQDRALACHMCSAATLMSACKYDGHTWWTFWAMLTCKSRPWVVTCVQQPS